MLQMEPSSLTLEHRAPIVLEQLLEADQMWCASRRSTAWVGLHAEVSYATSPRVAAAAQASPT